MVNQTNDPSIAVPSLDQGGEQELSNTKLQLVHFRKDEAKTYDLIQNPEGHGEPFIDDELEIRSYAPLGERIKTDPEFRNLFLGVIQSDNAAPPEHQSEMKEYHELGKDVTSHIPFEAAPGDSNPEIKKLAKLGHGGDSLMVLMPANLIYLLSVAHHGEENINKVTGFPEFGWNPVKAIGKVFSGAARGVGRAFRSNAVREVLRVGATVAGAVMGGPVGAALGSAAGSALTGRKPEDWLGQAVKAGALTYGAQALAPHIPGFGALGASMAGSGIPGMAQMGQTMGNWAAPGGAAALPGWGKMTSHISPTGQNLMGSDGSPLPGWGQMTSHISPTGQNLMGGSGALAQQGGNLFNNPLSGMGSMALAPLAIQGISGLLAHKADKENYTKWRDERDAWRRYEDEKEERTRERLGLNRPLQSVDMKRRINPRYGEPGESYFIYGDDERQGYKKGGKTKAIPKIWGKDVKDTIRKQDFVKSGYLLSGPGDGVSDSIYTQVPQDTFVVNAYTVAMVGNGDSQAGAKRIQEWLEAEEKKYGKSVVEYLKNITQTKPSVDVAFSAGEVPVFPYHVMLIGQLNLEKGHQLMDLFQKNIKKQKSNHKGVLPPDTKNLSFYLKK